MDLIDQAFAARETPTDWNGLAEWLRFKAAHIPQVQELIDASDAARLDGTPFPASAEEARRVMRLHRDRPRYSSVYSHRMPH